MFAIFFPSLFHHPFALYIFIPGHIYSGLCTNVQFAERVEYQINAKKCIAPRYYIAQKSAFLYIFPRLSITLGLLCFAGGVKTTSPAGCPWQRFSNGQ
jgi:hypothetical protein